MEKTKVVKIKWQPNIVIERYITGILGLDFQTVFVNYRTIIEPLFPTIQ